MHVKVVIEFLFIKTHSIKLLTKNTQQGFKAGRYRIMRVSLFIHLIPLNARPTSKIEVVSPPSPALTKEITRLPAGYQSDCYYHGGRIFKAFRQACLLPPHS